jgi:hypothetical protein
MRTSNSQQLCQRPPCRRTRGAYARATARVVAIALTALLTACTTGGIRTPYSQSRLIEAVHWDFSTIVSYRKALGSDLWPCAWAADGNLYCAWGDGGGFDGNDDHVGRVSLGFAQVSGTPSPLGADSFTGKNIWGWPPYAQFAADFGGKVGSMAAVGGVLYAMGGFWTTDNSADPVHASGRGPFNSIAWSVDAARSWSIASWSSPQPLGAFLDAGQDSTTAPAEYLFIYYLRSEDTHHVFLKRVRPGQLTTDPAIGGSHEYFSGAGRRGQQPHWAAREADAIPVFADPNNVQGPSVVFDRGLGRYLLTAGHYASGNDNDSTAGQVGLFEAPHPWGPWRTVGYYSNWGGLNSATLGDFLSLRLPSKWLSADGKTLWAVFSGLNSFDSFNVVRGVLRTR